LLNEVGGERSEHRHDVYIFGQLPLTLALAMIGAGIELAVVESSRGEVPTGTRLLLAGGVAVYLISMTVTDTGMSRRARSGWWWPLAAAAVALVDVALELPAVVVVGALAALLVAVLVVGTVQRTTGGLAVDQV
jgi:low temperature requirement protein LtrA